MAEFLDTQGVSYFLKKLINNANDKLYLISPYLQLNNQLKLSLEDRHKFSIDIIIIYGKVSDINPDDSSWLQSMPGIKLLFHKDLHAKCYFNEKEAIIVGLPVSAGTIEGRARVILDMAEANLAAEVFSRRAVANLRENGWKMLDVPICPRCAANRVEN